MENCNRPNSGMVSLQNWQMCSLPKWHHVT